MTGSPGFQHSSEHVEGQCSRGQQCDAEEDTVCIKWCLITSLGVNGWGTWACPSTSLILFLHWNCFDVRGQWENTGQVLHIVWRCQSRVGSAFSHTDSLWYPVEGRAVRMVREAPCCSQGLTVAWTSGTNPAVMVKQFYDIYVPCGSPSWLCANSVGRFYRGSSTALSSRNIIWTTCISLNFLVVTLKRMKKHENANIFI